MLLICKECDGEIVGKVRRGRCENCYRRHLGAMKRAGKYAPMPRKEYANRRNGIHIGERLHLWPVAAVFHNVTPGWGGCWIYTGPLNSNGYGKVSEHGEGTGAHRVAYRIANGAIPDGLQIDHTCHTESTDCAGGVSCIHRRCVNPNHLEAVTLRENSLRSLSLAAQNARKTHCVNGHEFTPENTRLRRRAKTSDYLRRECLTCKREYQEAYQQKWRAARKQGAN